MVEKERRKGNAYVESLDTSRPGWWSRRRQPLLLSVSLLVFVLLLSKHSLATGSPGCWLNMFAVAQLRWCLPVVVASILLQ